MLVHRASTSLLAALLLPACSSGAGQAPRTDAGTNAHDAAAKVDAADAAVEKPLCSVKPGTAGTVLRGTLLLAAGPTSGELLIGPAGTIVCAASSCSGSAGYAAATVVDCPSGVISPGLVDAHDHTEYATTGPEAHGLTRYEHRNDWRTGAEGATALPTVAQTTDTPTIAAQELRLVVGGATSVLGSGGVPGLARNLGLSTPSAPPQTEGLSGQPAFFDTFPLGDYNGQLEDTGCTMFGIEPAHSAFESGGRYTPHLAEGINLAAENELTCASQTANDLVTSATSVIHGVGMNANDVHALQVAGASLIWAPRSNISLYGNTTPVTELVQAGVSIALGTDWLPTGSMNMLRELACASFVNQKYFDGVLGDQDLFEMATIRGAAAAGFDAQIGSLGVGKQADVTVFDGTTNTGYRALIDGSTEDVRLVLRGGKVLYGEATTVKALSASCAAWEVCGAPRAVCIDTPGLTLARVEAVGTSVYPLASCRGRAPAGEPSCVPYRDSYPDGTSATDADGDGVPDTMDDCPRVFNPPRPMDGSSQADVDGDGVGDACDAFPLDPTKH